MIPLKSIRRWGIHCGLVLEKKNESTNERTIQEHDKAKVLQAMLKAGSNKAEAQELLKSIMLMLIKSIVMFLQAKKQKSL